MTDSPAQHVSPVPVIVITGSVGVGKTVVASEAARILREAQMPHAVVDLPQIGRAWPSPPDDLWNERLIHRNLAAMWSNFQAAGAGRLLLCRVLEERSLLRHVERAVPGCSCTVVRLHAPLAVVHARIRARESAQSADWYLNVAAYLTKRLDETRVEDILIETEDRSPAEIAEDLLRRARWLPY